MISLQDVRYSFSEAFHSLWRSRTRNLLSLATISISLAVTGVFMFASFNARAVARSWVRDIPLVFFLKDDVAEADIAALREKLSSSPLVEQTSYVTPVEALRRFKTYYARFADLAFDVGENAFPASFEVKLATTGSRGAMQSLVEDVKQMSCVSDVQFDEAWAKRLDATLLLIDLIGIFLGGVLVLASVFTISNVIRLNIYSCQEEIEIMMLVGATLGFIRAPFLIEGALQGFLGGLFSLGLLYAVVKAFILYVAPIDPLIASLVRLNFLPLMASLSILGGGMIMGLIGSITSVGKVARDS